GIEVAKNVRDQLQRLQAEAGILVATIVKRAEPQLRVVRHRGREGLPMLAAYRARKTMRDTNGRGAWLRLPFAAALPARVSRVRLPLNALLSTGRATRRVARRPIERRSTVIAARTPRPVPRRNQRAAQPRQPIFRLTRRPAIVPKLVAAPRLVRARDPSRNYEPSVSSADSSALGALIRQILSQ
ncbi:MAG: hypothetical protein AAFR23_04445, partial [Pseudomonadota bacterium]